MEPMQPVFAPRTTARVIPSLNALDLGVSTLQGFPHYIDREHWDTPAAEAKALADAPKLVPAPKADTETESDDSDDSDATDYKPTLRRRIKKTFRNLFTLRRHRVGCHMPMSDSEDESDTPAPTKHENPPFKYAIEAYFVPKGYYEDRKKYRKPWGILLRILLADLPHQIQQSQSTDNGCGPEPANTSKKDDKDKDETPSGKPTWTPGKHPGVPWRDHAPPNTQLADNFGLESDVCGRTTCGCCRQWGRRIVFEPELPPPGRENDRWLAVAYVLGNDRQWVEDVDIRELISFQKAQRIVGQEIEDTAALKRKWKVFYDLQRDNKLRTAKRKVGDKDSAYKARAKLLQHQLRDEVLTKLLG